MYASRKRQYRGFMLTPEYIPVEKHRLFLAWSLHIALLSADRAYDWRTAPLEASEEGRNGQALGINLQDIQQKGVHVFHLTPASGPMMSMGFLLSMIIILA